jgi:lipoyl(octanoyl) transferase
MQVRVLGRVEYLPTFQAMAAFTEGSGPGTPDELWLCEHPPVFTQGLAGKADHVLEPGDIPVVATNRGGQVTYHGPGQVVAYPLLDLKRAGYFVKEYVYRLEEAWSAPWPLRRDRAPGGGRAGHLCPAGRPRLARGADRPGPGGDPFAGLGKIAALGIKVSRHRTYHGLALNVGMDLEPFERINPCGYAGLRTVDLSTIGVSTTWNEAAAMLGHELQALLAPQDIP